MQNPLEIKFLHMDSSEALDSLIRARVTKMEKLHGHVNSCRVVVERVQFHGHPGCSVKIEVGVPPRKELVVNKDSSSHDPGKHNPTRAVIDEAFDALEGQLKKFSSKQKGDVKTHTQEEVEVVEEDEEAVV